MRSDTINTVLLAILLGALIYIGCEQVILSRKMLYRLENDHMTDPGPLELKASWIHTYDSNHNPIYHNISVVRNAPSETITDWEQRFKDTVAADLVDPDTRPVQ